MRLSWLLALAAAGSQGAGAYPTPDEVTARVATMHLAAPCVLQRDARQARRYVLADTQIEADAAWASIRSTTSRCIGHFSLQLQPLELRGALAEALLKGAGGTLLTRATALPAATPIRMARVTAPRYPSNLVACATAADPVHAADLLVVEPGTAEERRRLNTFQSALDACMPVGQKVAMIPAVTRVLVATALYHRVTGEGAVG